MYEYRKGDKIIIFNNNIVFINFLNYIGIIYNFFFS